MLVVVEVVAVGIWMYPAAGTAVAGVKRMHFAGIGIWFGPVQRGHRRVPLLCPHAGPRTFASDPLL